MSSLQAKQYQSPSPRRQMVTASIATTPPQLSFPPQSELSAGQSRVLPLQQMPPQPPQLPLWSFGSPRQVQQQVAAQEVAAQPVTSEFPKDLSSSFFQFQQVMRPSSHVRSVSRTVTPRAISPLGKATPSTAASAAPSVAPSAAPSTPIQPACWLRTSTPGPATVKVVDSRTQDFLEHVQGLKASLQVLIEERVADLSKRLENFEERFERSLVVEHEEREEGILNLQRELRQQKDRSFMDIGRKDLSDSLCKRQDTSLSELQATPRISKDGFQTSLAEFSQSVEKKLDAKFEVLCRRTDIALNDVAEQKSELATTIEKALAELCGGLALRQQEELQSVRRQVQEEQQRLQELLDRQQLQPLPGDVWTRPPGNGASAAGVGHGLGDLVRRQDEQSLLLQRLQQESEELRQALERVPLQAADLEASIAHLRADVICQQEKQNIAQQDVQNVGRLQQQMKRQIVELSAEMRLSVERGNLAVEKVQAKLEACQVHPEQLQQVSGRVAGLETMARESHGGADSDERITQLERGVEDLREAMRTSVTEAQRLAGQVWGELALRAAAEQRNSCRLQASESVQALPSTHGVQRGRTPTPRGRPRSAPRHTSRTANVS
mmetsp:Transcript_39234/g.68994  ORF Transcript_39234/g.68994 Transcript_39234/m.68994 type:complete len:609 (+) Transcript_39234:39-1865(+)